jgi:TatD DNase family protein
MLEIFDSHAHLSKEFFEDISEVVQRARNANVNEIVTVGSSSNPAVMEEAIEVASTFEGVYAAIGIHPHEAQGATDKTFSAFEALLGHEKVVAVGETGLDFHYNFSSKESQIEVFKRQIAIARDRGLPIVVHCREAHEECLGILSEVASQVKGVIHCFTGDLETARRYVGLGFFVSIPGVVTFRNARTLKETVKGLLVERMLVETDSPYLSPEPMRGKRCEPAYVTYTVQAIASIKGLSLEDVARITTLNARRLFGLSSGDYAQPKITYGIRDSLYINVTNRCTLHCTFCGKFRDFYVKGHNLRLKKDPSAQEICEALQNENLERYKEVVFCGYGEPLLRLDVVKEVAKWLKERGKKVRVNTDGLANLVHKRNCLEELRGLVDEISVSLNAQDAKTYAKYCRSKYGEQAFQAVLDFMQEAKKIIPQVVATVVTLPDVDIEACRRLALGLGVAFRVRPLDDIG